MIRKLLRMIYKFMAIRHIIKYEEPLRINGFSRFNGNIELGKNTNFNGMNVIGRGKVEIGDNFHSGPGCLMITEIHDYDTGDAIPYGNTYHLKNINIGNNVWLGSRVIILGGLSIGEGAIVQAGAVVVKDIPPFAIAGGNPAKVFKNRDIEHYEILKERKKFL